MRYLRNRLDGYGIASGLSVNPADGRSVVVGPGVAIDIRGREIVLASECRLDLSTLLGGRTSRDVNVRWDQVPDAYIASSAPGEPDELFTRWIERPNVTLEPVGRADETALTLARLSPRGKQEFSIDLSVRKDLHPPIAISSER
jgi:hypothetical protein